MNVLEIKQTAAINPDLRREIKGLKKELYPYGTVDRNVNNVIDDLVRFYNMNTEELGSTFSHLIPICKTTREKLPLILEKYDLEK